MVRAASTLAVEPEIHRGNAEVLQERRVIGAGSERADRQIRALARCLASCRWGTHDFGRAHPALQRRTGFRIGNVACDSVDELLEYVRATDAQISASGVVAVQICDCMRAQVRGMRLRPFRGAQYGRFLAVPCSVDDRALWIPSLFLESAECAHLFELCDEARDRIVRAVDPRVVMIRTDHQLIRLRAAGDTTDDVVHRLDIPVGFDYEMNARSAGPDLVRDRKRAAPVARCDVAG